MIRIIIKGLLWSVIVVVTLECCARLDDWISYGASPLGLYDTTLLNAYDSLGQHGRPHGQYLKWKLNSLGFRGPELDEQAFRVLCVGSSETFGQYESEEHEWPRELERLLNKESNQSRIQVVNTGFAGETFPTSLRRLPERLALVRPKMVLFYPSLAHYLSLPALRAPRPPAPQPAFRWRMETRIDNTIKKALPQSFQTWLRQRQIDEQQSSIPHFDRMPLEYLQEYQKDLLEAIELTRKAGAEPVLITHANRFKNRVDPNERFMLVSWRRFYPMLREDAFLSMEDSMNDVARNVAREQNVLLIDAARAMPSGPEYFADFVHFTDKGSATFSNIVAQKLMPQFAASAPPLGR